MLGNSGWHAGAPPERIQLFHGHEHDHHVQLRPHPHHLPHRGKGLLQQGQQLQREKHDPEISVRHHQAEQRGLGF